MPNLNELVFSDLPVVSDIEIVKGAAYRPAEIVWEAAATFDLEGNPLTYAPVDLTGWTGTAEIKESVRDDTVLHELNLGNAGFIMTPLDGKIVLYIPDEVTDTFDFKCGYWRILLEDPAGDITRLMEGKVKLRR